MNDILVLHSGGLDSTVVLHWAIHQPDVNKVRALNIIYGQKHAKEREYAEWTCRKLGVEQIDADLTDVFQFNPDVCSLLAESNQALEHSDYAEQVAATNGAPVASYVPYRNGLFLSYAAAVAYQLGCDAVAYGAHKDDAAGSAYPDCSSNFFVAQKCAIYEGTGGKVTVAAPLIDLNKAGVVALGLSCGMTHDDFAHTWSCYEGKEHPCGVCGTCRDRKAAFLANGITDID